MSKPKIPLLTYTRTGLYCEAGNFYIDPMKAVDVAVVTHAHSDHARRGSSQYYCARPGVELLKTRLGLKISVQGIPYRQEFVLGKVKVSFHSAGHILGSAQVRIEHEGEVWVASGDYKREADPSCDPFEVVRCETFVTEATFGTPKYVWDKNVLHGKMISEWWLKNAGEGCNSVLFGYSLGKAQRILAELEPFAQKSVLIYSTISELTACYRNEGRRLAATEDLMKAVATARKFSGDLILCPPSVLKEEVIRAIRPYKTAFASGWMQGASSVNSIGHYDHGFVMSDHADWEGLNQTIQETGANRVFIQHRNGALIRHLRRKGMDANPVEDLNSDFFSRLPEVNLSLF